MILGRTSEASSSNGAVSRRRISLEMSTRIMYGFPRYLGPAKKSRMSQFRELEVELRGQLN
jgi:hypothetical protein